MKSFARLGWTIPAAALLALPLACGGGGGGGDSETTVAASSTQVGQAVLVAGAAIEAATLANDTASGVVGTASVAPASVNASAMDMGGMFGAGDFSGIGPGMGSFDLEPVACDGSGTVAAHMQWADLHTDTMCIDGLMSTLTLDNCVPMTGQLMDGQMGLSFIGSTCEPTAIGMTFSGATVTVPEGTLSGNFTMDITGMMFAGDPATGDITGATVTFDGRMHMAGSGFGSVTMDMDQLAYHFSDPTHTADVNGILTVHCNDQAFPMAMVTDANGLTLDAEGNLVGGHMTVTSEGTTHTVEFNPDGSIDVTPEGGTMVHLTAPEPMEFCDL
jgi:hypothetical protein